MRGYNRLHDRRRNNNSTLDDAYIGLLSKYVLKQLVIIAGQYTGGTAAILVIKE